MIFLEKPENFNPKCEVVGCFLEHHRQILLLHRQDHKSEGNTWGIPGGKIEKGETPNDAAIRETLEETGFILPKDLVIYLTKVYIQQEGFSYIYHMVRCTPLEHPASVKIDYDAHKGFTWVTPTDALKMSLMKDEDACINLIYENNLARSTIDINRTSIKK